MMDYTRFLSLDHEQIEEVTAGFLKHPNRLPVACTRAASTLILIASKSILEASHTGQAVSHWFRKYGEYFDFQAGGNLTLLANLEKLAEKRKSQCMRWEGADYRHLQTR